MGSCFSKKKLLEQTEFNTTPAFTLDNIKTNIKVLKVYDGDTIWISIHLYGRFLKFKVRMLGYDSPELHPKLNLPNRNEHMKRAIDAKQYLESLILNKIVTGEFYKFDKYGRALCNIYIPDPSSKTIICKNPVCVNTLMIRNGHGVPYMGGSK